MDGVNPPSQRAFHVPAGCQGYWAESSSNLGSGDRASGWASHLPVRLSHHVPADGDFVIAGLSVALVALLVIRWRQGPQHGLSY